MPAGVSFFYSRSVIIWFESHATSLDNERGLASGHIDAELSDLGRRQAEELGRRHSESPLLTVYTSDLKRSVQTAEIAFDGRSLPVIPDARLRECDYGQWSRCPIGQLEASRLRFIDTPFPNGESYRDVVLRVGEFLEDVAQGEGQILLIGHRATWYALEHLLKNRDLVDVIASEWRWQPGWLYQR